AGLLGIGGGAIMVPLLVMLFEAQGLPREQVLHLAVGSGMATILLTSISSVRAHAQRGALRWDLVKAMTPGILVGGLVGSAVAGAIPTRLFAVLFCIVVYIASANMLLDRKPQPSRAAPGAAGMFLAGFVISATSAFAAIGGAFMTVPFMLYCNVPLLQAIGCAAAIGFPIALAGTTGFIASGLAQGGLPAWSVGYVYLPAVLGVALTSVLLAPAGAAFAHRLKTKTLKRIFAGLLFVMATKMLITLW
ncbi:MAG: sulfite exporter TauE/SafE family protein, partial [Burkholderiales bacterium]|nr:sulfite exporter TauE/SafE family protein [Burkholderiales bacterium]